MVGLRTSDCTIISMYGPQWLDRKWMSEALDFVKQTSSLGHPIFVVGDLNWRNAYNSLLTLGWKIDRMEDGGLPVTNAVGTAPTRALFWGDPQARGPTFINAKLLPGIPHHCLVWYGIDIPFITLPRFRLRHTAGYTLAREATDAELYDLQDTLDAECGPPHDGRIDLDLDEDAADTLLEKWSYWHQRAEMALVCAMNVGIVELQRAPERPKGSKPTQRPVSNASRHRPEQSIAHRRLLRLHRQLSEFLRQGNSSLAQLTPSHFKKFAQAAYDGILSTKSTGIPVYVDALEAISSAVAREEALLQKSVQRAWKQKFAKWSDSIWAVATPMFKAVLPSTCCTVQQMRQQWEKTMVSRTS